MTEEIGKIEKLIVDSLKSLGTLYKGKPDMTKPYFSGFAGNEGDPLRIVVPMSYKKSGKDSAPTNLRISEQEARFAFISILERTHETHDFFYSVEAPTEQKYKFSGKDINGNEIDKDEPIISDAGRSARVDVCLYSNTEVPKKYYIEFKCRTVKQPPITKDFLKLLQDNNNECNFFVHIIENHDDNTIKTIRERYFGDEAGYEGALQRIKAPYQAKRVKIFLYCLNYEMLWTAEIDQNGTIVQELKETPIFIVRTNREAYWTE